VIADSEDDDDDDNEQTIAAASAASAAVKVIQRRLALTTAVKTPCSEDWRVNMPLSAPHVSTLSLPWATAVHCVDHGSTWS